jgi:GntR family transcriptional regulator, transcriptional repressor for pyruvate dehydrogenase complex
MMIDGDEIVPRTNLVDLVIGRIQDWILKGEIKLGEKLPSEKEMMVHFKVSKSVIREAISRLNGLHLIDTYQGKGSFVSDESQKLLSNVELVQEGDDFSIQMWEFRELFEPQIAQLAAQKRSDSDLEKFSNLIKALDAAIMRNEIGYQEDDLLHFVLAQSTHNFLLEKVAVNIARMSEPFKRLSLARPFRSSETCEEWHAIYRAVEEQDFKVARQAMYQHIRKSRGTFVESNPSD